MRTKRRMNRNKFLDGNLASKKQREVATGKSRSNLWRRGVEILFRLSLDPLDPRRARPALDIRKPVWRRFQLWVLSVAHRSENGETDEGKAYGLLLGFREDEIFCRAWRRGSSSTTCRKPYPSIAGVASEGKVAAEKSAKILECLEPEKNGGGKACLPASGASRMKEKKDF